MYIILFEFIQQVTKTKDKQFDWQEEVMWL